MVFSAAYVICVLPADGPSWLSMLLVCCRAVFLVP